MRTPRARFAKTGGWWFAVPAGANVRDDTFTLAADDQRIEAAYCDHLTGMIRFGRLAGPTWRFHDVFGPLLIGSAGRTLDLSSRRGKVALAFAARRVLHLQPMLVAQCGLLADGEWTTTVIDESLVAAGPVVVGFAPDGSLKAAYCTGGATRTAVFGEYHHGTWLTQVVDAFGDIGPEVAMTLAPAPMVAYAVHKSNEKADLRMARKESDGWVIEEVAQDVPPPTFVGVAASEAEATVVACSANGLAAYLRTAGGWQVTVLVPPEEAPASAAMTCDSRGRPFLAYISAFGLCCAYRVSDVGWYRCVVLGRAKLRRPQIAVDNNGDIHVAAIDSSSHEIIYATTSPPPRGGT